MRWLGKEKSRRCPGYLTVFLALILAVMLSLCLALIEGTRSNCIRMETEIITDIGLNSILAEYHRMLFDQYNLFAVDTSYGSSEAACANTAEHLKRYLEGNLPEGGRDFLAMTMEAVDISGVTFLTDEAGAVFRRRAVEAVRDDCNLTLARDLEQWMQRAEGKEFFQRDVEEEWEQAEQEIAPYFETGSSDRTEDDDSALPENPTSFLAGIKKKGILRYVVDQEMSLSDKRILAKELVGERMKQKNVNTGNLYDEADEEQSFINSFFFREYLLRYFRHYDQGEPSGALDYEIEYLIGGKEEDIENLKSVAWRLSGIREAANAEYLFQNGSKCGEAEILAVTLALLLQSPELTEPLKNAILLGWAYAESLYDVKQLLAGGKVPLIKTDADWHYGLSEALSLAESSEEDLSERGLDYSNYLRILLMLEDEKTLTTRAMNMMEANIRMSPGNSAFRLDGCAIRILATIEVGSRFGYRYFITRKKEYG